MSLIIGLGSNLNDRADNLKQAHLLLKEELHLLESSQIYESAPVDYTSQPYFLNQVSAFATPSWPPDEILDYLQSIERNMGRVKVIDKGPRVIDLDLLFLDSTQLCTEHLTIPHPALFERSFVLLPLAELRAYDELQKHFSFKTVTESKDCYPFKA